MQVFFFRLPACLPACLLCYISSFPGSLWFGHLAGRQYAISREHRSLLSQKIKQMTTTSMKHRHPGTRSSCLWGAGRGGAHSPLPNQANGEAEDGGTFTEMTPLPVTHLTSCRESHATNSPGQSRPITAGHSPIIRFRPW